jgi:hypothetical protein
MDIPHQGIDSDFCFVVGSEELSCSRLVADFLSPRVKWSHWVDPTTEMYVIDTVASKSQFESFLALGHGSSLTVDFAEASVYLALAEELGNRELCQAIQSQLSPDLYFSKILGQAVDPTFLDMQSESSISLLASSFWRLPRETLDALPVPILFQILDHPSLQISSENHLYDFISSRAPSDPTFFGLFRFVRFEYLSADCITHFISMSARNFERLDAGSWSALCSRLALDNSITNPTIGFREVHCPLGPARLNGIIRYLSHAHGGNFVEKGIVTITSKSVEDYLRNSPKHVLDYKSFSYFHSWDQPNQWICLDFGERRVRPTNYAIRRVEYFQGDGTHLKSWIVESSLDGEDWAEIDRRTDNYDLCQDSPVVAFDVSNSAECRFIRLTQIGENHNGDDHLSISAFELFGTLLEPPGDQHTLFE